MRLGFVGTGTMGAPMALCLIDAGHELTVCDLRPAVTAPLALRGAREAGSPADVARHSEVVFTSLPGPSEVEHAALDSATGILAGLASGGAYIDMTTNAPPWPGESPRPAAPAASICWTHRSAAARRR